VTTTRSPRQAASRSRRPEPTTDLIERTWRDRPEAARRLFVAAVDAFADKGYPATTTRDLASRVGLSPAAVYVHFKSKEELLYEISRVGNDEALRATRASADTTDPTQRLFTLVNDYATFLGTYHTMARVILHEYKFLSPLHHDEISAKRRQTVAMVRAAVENGVQAGAFVVPDVTGVVTAIMAICVDITNWFPSKAYTEPHSIGALYAHLAVRIVGGSEPDS
jgi:AcrR family transcriptional regulator